MTGVRASAKPAAKKTPAKKAPVKKATAVKATAEKGVAEKTVAKTPAKKATKAVPAKKVAAIKAPAKKAVAKEAPAKKAAPTKTASDGRLTTTELSAIRAQLAREHDEMQAEYDQSVIALNDLQQTNSDGAGDDQADAGSKTFDREQEQSITANRQDLLRQIEHALERIDAGTYGLCENCGKPIPKARLQALPMATLDAACKVREERH